MEKQFMNFIHTSIASGDAASTSTAILHDIDNAKKQFHNAIASNNGNLAAAILSDLYMFRHDTWGKEICTSLKLPFRDDVDVSEIIAEIDQQEHIVEEDANILENIAYTPDNYFLDWDTKEIHLIDYKVQTNIVNSQETAKQYKLKFKDFNLIDWEIRVHVILYNPNLKQHITIGDHLEWDIYRTDLTDSVDLITSWCNEIITKYKDDEFFNSRYQSEVVDKSKTWVKTDVSVNLFEHKNFQDFLSTLGVNKDDILESLMHEKKPDETFNDVLARISGNYEQYVNKIATEHLDGDYKKHKEPSKEIIQEAWDKLQFNCKSKFDVKDNLIHEKPSCHFTWAKDSLMITRIINGDNIARIQKLAGLLQLLEPHDVMSNILKMIGDCTFFGADDLKDNVDRYRIHIEQLKTFIYKDREQKGLIRQNKDAMAKMKEPIGQALCGRSQEFYFNTKNFPNRKRILNQFNEYAHIGHHKQFNNTTIADITPGLKKPIKILDVTNEDLRKQIEERISTLKKEFEGKTEINLDRFFYQEVEETIKNIGTGRETQIKEIMSSQYFKCAIDISTLMKGAITNSRFSNYQSFRIITSGSRSTYLILLPSDQIQKKNTQIVYIIVTLHENQCANFGANGGTYQIPGTELYITTTRPMRLDKTRLKRLCSLPQQFLLTAMSFLNEEDNLNVDDDVLFFSFMLSASCNKSMLTLAEPARYILMNSTSIISDVYGFITEKFDPRPKTFFSIYFFQKLIRASLEAQTSRSLFKSESVTVIDGEVIKKGMSDVRNLPSIWFNKLVNIKEFINEIYTPHYINPKGLHNQSHNIISLLKVPIDIEQGFPNEWNPWLYPKEQTVDLSLFMFGVANYYKRKQWEFKNLRNRIEQNNNFLKPIFSIDTMVSSKSCLQVGDYESVKMKYTKNNTDKDPEIKKRRQSSIRMSKEIPNYVKHITNKVYDDLYTKTKNNMNYFQSNFIDIAFDNMESIDNIYITMFEKGQRTAVDREIYQGSLELKTCMYAVERIYKEQCNLDNSELISKPGDMKLKEIQKVRNRDIAHLVKTSKEYPEMSHTLLEINADMSKWSAKDIFYKYFVLVCLDPNLYREEKEHILLFFCKYLDKKIIVPDSAMQILMEQIVDYRNIMMENKQHPTDDHIRIATNNFTQNWFNVGQNWLQGNFNYMSSFVHAICMQTFKDIIEITWSMKSCIARTTSLVHSDDNQTSIVICHPKTISKLEVAQRTLFSFTDVEKRFGFTVNTKKTYVNEIIKEFVSLFNLNGEPYSVYARFLLPSIGDTAFMGPYQDLSSRLSSVQTALRHGCPPSLAHLSIMCAAWITYDTYSMMPGQINDPCTQLSIRDRKNIPLELGGYPRFDLGVFTLLGVETHDLMNLIEIFDSSADEELNKTGLWDYIVTHERNLSFWQRFYIKYIRFVTLDQDVTLDKTLGESYDMRSRSIITPKLFSNPKVLRKLDSFQDFLTSKESNHNELLQYIESNIFLTIGKAETPDEYIHMIKYRYFSRKFRESMSISSLAHLFIEQILNANNATIDFNTIKDGIINLDDTDLSENTAFQGKYTIAKAIKEVMMSMSAREFDTTDMNIVFRHKFLTDPAITSILNGHLLFRKSYTLDKNNSFVEKMPQFALVRQIVNTPANIIRYRITGEIPKYCQNDIDTFLSDVAVLEEFELAIDLAGKKLRQRERFTSMGIEENRIQIAVETHYLQLLYSYLRQGKYTNKYCIIPQRTKGTQDFITTVLGNSIHDLKFYKDKNIKPILSLAPKGEIKPMKLEEKILGKNYLKSLATLINNFVEPNSRAHVLQQTIDCTSIHGLTGQQLKDIALSDPNIRRELHGISFKLGYLTEEDINILKIQDEKPRVIWETAQIDRISNQGPFKVSVQSTKVILQVEGLNDKLDLIKIGSTGESIRRSVIRYCKILTNNNLNLYNFKEIRMDPRGIYMSVRRYKSNHKVKYDFYYGNHDSIISENSRLLRVNPNETGLYKAIAPIEFQRIQSNVLNNKSIIALNTENNNLLTFKISHDFTLYMTRASDNVLSKVVETKKCQVKGLNITKFIKSRFASNNRSAMTLATIDDLLPLFECNGTSIDYIDFSVLAESSVMEQDFAELNNDVFPIVELSKLSANNYRQTVQSIIRRIIANEWRTMIADGVNLDYNPIFKNNTMKYFYGVNQIANELGIDNKYFHYLIYSTGNDGLYHNISEIPKSIYNGEFIWEKLKLFLQAEFNIENDRADREFKKLKSNILAHIDTIFKNLKTKHTYDAWFDQEPESDNEHNSESDMYQTLDEDEENDNFDNFW